MSLVRSVALITAMAMAAAAEAQESKRVVLKDSNGTIIGTVIDAEAGSTIPAYVSLPTEFGPTMVKFYKSTPAVSSFTKLYTTSDCSDTPTVQPNPGIWAESFIDDTVNHTLLAVDPGTTQNRNIIRRIDVPGFPVCTAHALGTVQTAELVPVMDLSAVYPGGYTLENYKETTFHALTPCRLLDTRLDQTQTDAIPLTNPGPHPFRVQGNCGVPNGARSVALNLTVTGGTKNGDVRLYPFAQTPTVNDPSSINFTAGQTIANAQLLTLSPVAAAGDKDMKVIIGMAGAAASGSVHVIVDVTGYFD